MCIINTFHFSWLADIDGDRFKFVRSLWVQKLELGGIHHLLLCDVNTYSGNLTYFMKHGTSWEDSSFLAYLESVCLSWNLKFCYDVYKSLLRLRVLSQMSQFSNLIYCSLSTFCFSHYLHSALCACKSRGKG